MPTISIIVPVYKVEQYLRRCLDSIVAQTFTDWECILIDDGSPDNSGKICDEYADKDRRFRVFHQENAGVSTARNKGLDEAKGEWIGFVDSDDWIEKNYMDTLFSNAQKKCLIIGGIRHTDKKTINKLVNETVSSDYFITQLFSQGKYGYVGYIFPKLYESSIIKDEHIRFHNEIYYNEDRLFVLQYTLHCDEVVICDSIVYNYFQRDDSAMGQTRTTFSVKMITELNAFKIMQDLLQNKHKIAFSRCSYNAFNATRALLRRCNKESKLVLKAYKKHFFKSSFKTCGFKEKIKCLINYFRS